MSADSARFEALFRAHYVAVHRYLVRRLPAASVQDALSETFLVAWRRQSEIHGDPLPWLLGVARRVSANQLRAQARREALHERLAEHAPAQAEGVESLTDTELLHVLASLSEADREALLLVAWEGLSHSQAARVVGCAAPTFAVRLHRARRRLTKALGPSSSITYPGGAQEEVTLR